MTVLALDLGTRIGWAFLDKKGKVTHGTELFSAVGLNVHGERFFKFHEWLIPKLKQSNAVVYEDVYCHVNYHAAHSYGGLRGVLLCLAYKYRVDAFGVNVTTIKKSITGNGKAKKAQVIEAVRGLGYNPYDDNDADALALLHTVLKQKDLFHHRA